jgi:hypothetical protein
MGCSFLFLIPGLGKVGGVLPSEPRLKTIIRTYEFEM